MTKTIILLSLLFNSGCLKFSGEESSSNSVPIFDKSPTVSKKRESKTLDFELKTQSRLQLRTLILQN